ncbi:CCA tRNA nucleotidyltransferase [Planctomicrobium sp. SH664]|uniref:CCA tRNA nucleotidyltransferase n=1 Tax=Planctomicrobium sp. SH664 TaxID=3448125 RepID=UPI003F5B26D0
MSDFSREFSIEVVRKLTANGHVAYWAGGCVRDLLRNAHPQDYDVATSATPQQVRRLFGMKRTLAVGESFGVIIVLGPANACQVEVATFRKDGPYHDGRRPQSVEFSSPREDALRRDFTINGMFYDPLTDKIHDFVGGKQDLEQKIVRAIGDPAERMEEDKLRMLRAVRFAARLGYALDADTARVISQMSSAIRIVSAERIAQELRKMLGHPTRDMAMKMCAELHLLAEVLPEVVNFSWTKSSDRWNQLLHLQQRLGDVSFEVALAALLRDTPPGEERRNVDRPESGSVFFVCRRLKLSNDETDRIGWLSRHRDAIPASLQQPLSVRKRLASHPQFSSLLHLERRLAEIEGKSLLPFEQIEEFLRLTPAEELSPPELIGGRDLIALGHRPGPQFRTWLDTVRDAQLNSQIHTRDEAIEMVEQLAREWETADGKTPHPPED